MLEIGLATRIARLGAPLNGTSSPWNHSPTASNRCCNHPPCIVIYHPQGAAKELTTAVTASTAERNEDGTDGADARHFRRPYRSGFRLLREFPVADAEAPVYAKEVVRRAVIFQSIGSQTRGVQLHSNR
jgi:hypothetical protein